MLHVRVVCPPDRTSELTGFLAGAPGVSAVLVQAGARRPSGDAISFDVLNRAANPVFATMRELGLDRTAGIAIEQVDAELTDEPRADAHAGVLEREIAPVWELVDATVKAGAWYAPSFYILLTIASLIAATGILDNSLVLIVGAMIVGPEYNAIISVALGIMQRQRQPVRDGLLALLCGFLAAVIVTLLYGLAIRATGHTPEPFLHGVRPVAVFIYAPNLFSVIVAILAGIVGVVSLTQARTAALIGVFISVTTIPAAASLGISIAYAGWREATGSLIQLLLNVSLLIATGAVGLGLQRRIWRSRWAGPTALD